MYNSLTRPWGIRLKIVWSFMTLFVEHADWMLFEFEQILLSFANSKPAKDNTCSSCVKYLKKLKLAHEMHLPRILLVFSLWYSKPIPLLLIAKLDQSSADINTLPAKTCTTEERPWRKNENTQTVPCWHFLPFLSQIAGCNLYSAHIHTSKQVQAGALLNFFSLFPLDQQHWCAKATSPKVLDCLPQHLLPMSLYFSLLPNNFRSEVF